MNVFRDDDDTHTFYLTINNNVRFFSLYFEIHYFVLLSILYIKEAKNLLICDKEWFLVPEKKLFGKR